MMQLFTGKQYLKIDIANSFGLDKENWDTRLNWFENNESKLESLIKKADKPALFYAGIQAWNHACKGTPSGYPISLDATSSGIQILSVLTGDRAAARHCNVVDTGKREDAYTGLYNALLEKTGQTAKVSREDTKQAIMTAFYSSKAVPKRIFGNGKLLEMFFDTMKQEAPGAWELTETMEKLWNPTKYSNNWIMPDNHHVRIKVLRVFKEYVHFLNNEYEVEFTVNEPMKENKSLGANVTHSVDGMMVREMVRRCSYNPSAIEFIGSLCKGTNKSINNDPMVTTLWDHYKDSGFLSARILDHLNDQNIGMVDKQVILELINSLPKKPFTVLTVHDCFRCLPNYGNDLRIQYNRLLSEIAKSELLCFLISQLRGVITLVKKLDENLYKDVLEANYALS